MGTKPIGENTEADLTPGVSVFGLHTKARVHPTHRRRGRHKLLGALGPGLITGAADDDPSGIGTYSQIGAQFGLAMLWTVPISIPLAAAVEELAGRIGLARGRGLATEIKQNFPAPVLYAATLLVAAANIFNIGADLGAMDASLRLVIAIPYVPLLITIVVVLLVLEVFVKYHHYARLLRFLTISLLAYIVVLAVVHVDWPAVARNLVIPNIKLTKDYATAVIAIFGTTISPYLMFWQCSEEVEETEELKGAAKRLRGRIGPMRVDVIIGMTAAVFIMFAIMVATASTLGAHGITNIGTADQAAQALKPLAGNLAGTLFAIGIVGTGALAVPVLAGSTAYAVSETLGWHEGLSRHFMQARGFFLVVVGAMLIGLALNFVGIDPIKALVYSAFFNGVTAPPLILLMLILANKKRAMGSYRSGWVSNLIVGAALLVMTVPFLIYLLPS